MSMDTLTPPSTRRVTSLTCAALAALMLSSCTGKGGKERPAPGKAKEPTRDAAAPDATPPPPCTLTFAIEASAPQLDPMLAADATSMTLITNLVDGLTRFPTQEGPVELAGASEVRSSPDALIYTFKLRPGQKWTDGAPVTAKDYLYAWQRALEASPPSPRVSNLFIVKGAEAFHQQAMAFKQGKGPAPDFATVMAKAPDPSTLTLELNTVGHHLKELAATPPFLPVPAHLVEKVGDDWTKPAHYVSNGRFKLAPGAKAETPELVPNPQHPASEKIALDHVTTKIVPSEKLIEAFRKGEIQWTGTRRLPYGALADPAMEPGYRADPFLGTVVMVVNHRRKPLDELDVRKAIVYSIDRNQLTIALKDGRRPATHLFPEDTRSPTPSVVDFNRDSAREMLKSAKGVPKGKPLRLTLVHPDTITEALVAKEIARQLTDTLGAEVEVFKEGPEAPSVADSDLRIVVHHPRTRAIQTGVEAFAPGGTHNLYNWTNKEYAQYLKDADFTREEQANIFNFVMAESVIIRAGVVSPLVNESRTHLFKRGYRNLGINTSGVYALDDILCPPTRP